MKRALAASVLTILICHGVTARGSVDEAVLRAEADRVAVIAKAREATLAIFTNQGQGGGSGVVISSDGYALTNYHVVSGAGEALKCGMAHGGLYDAVVVGIDPVGDVALIQLFGRDDFPCATLGDSDDARVGDWVYVIGNPFLLANDFRPTVTYGILSGVHRYQYPAGTLLEYADCLQTDASINPGNSGGPLFDSVGRLIGINGRGSFEKRGRVNVGVGYAISINQIKNFMGCLRGGRIVDHATLGARVASQEDGRVMVSDILDSSDAFRRGLRYGDELIAFAGRPIGTVNAFKNALGTLPKGWRVPLVFQRKGERHEVLVRLSGVHGAQELIDKVSGRPKVELPGPKPKQESPKPESPQPGAPEPDGPAPLPDPGGKPSPGRRTPRLPLPHATPDKKPPPEIVEQHFDGRRGYANYYYNRLNRDRVWQALLSHGDFTALAGDWLLRGELVGAGEAEFQISDQLAGCALPGGKLKLPVGDSLSSASEPPTSGGLLAALFLWRRFLVKGPERFGGMEYYGTLPLAVSPGLPGQVGLAEQAVLVDMLVGTFGGVECRYLLDPVSGRLLVLELFLRDDDDPCELHFFDYRAIDGREVPGRLLVRYGDTIYGMFTFDEVRFGEGRMKDEG